MCPDVAPRKYLFEVLEEGRVYGHDIFEVSVLRAILHLEDLAVTFDDLCFDLSGFLVNQIRERPFALQDFLPDFRYAFRAQRIGRSGKA